MLSGDVSPANGIFIGVIPSQTALVCPDMTIKPTPLCLPDEVIAGKI